MYIFERSLWLLVENRVRSKRLASWLVSNNSGDRWYGGSLIMESL